MIYLNTTEIYIPKSRINAGGVSIRLENGVTKNIIDASVAVRDFYYKLSDNQIPQLPDGQYNYEVYTDCSVYDSGVAQKGDFLPADCSIYENKIQFITYEG